jgi:hypothetical protein
MNDIKESPIKISIQINTVTSHFLNSLPEGADIKRKDKSAHDAYKKCLK